MAYKEPVKEHIISIQRDHLDIWKTKLNSKIYKELEAWATKTNKSAEAMKVRRGSDLYEFIVNWKP